MHTLYLPRPVLERLKAAAIAGAGGGRYQAEGARQLQQHLQQQKQQAFGPASIQCQALLVPACLPARPPTPLACLPQRAAASV